MNNEQIKNALFLTATALCGGILALVAVKYLLPVLLPFLISYTIASLTTAPAIALGKKIRAPRNKLRLFISLFALLILSLAIFGIGKYAALTLWQIASSLLEGDKLSGLIENVFKSLESLPGRELPIDLEAELTDTIRGLLTSLASSLATLLGSAVSLLPKIFLFLVATFISLVYFALDLEELNKKIRSILPVSPRVATPTLQVRESKSLQKSRSISSARTLTHLSSSTLSLSRSITRLTSPR